MKISVVSPVYLGENMLDDLVNQIDSALSGIADQYEVILVEDASPDASWVRICELCSQKPFVKGIKLSRNFGQHSAVLAGVGQSSGDVIVLLDCDLQDNPEHIVTLLKEFQKGNDIVFTRRIDRKHSFFKYFTAKIYNAVFSLLSDSSYDLDVGSLVLFSKQVQIEFLKLKERDTLYIQGLKWLGFKHTYVYVEHGERHSGKSSYTLSKLFNLAIQGWISNSEKLLFISIKIGLLFTLFSILSIIFIVFNYFTNGYQNGWPSLISSILLSTGLILTSLGVLGIYVGKIINEVRGRPRFVIENKINFNEE